MMATMGFVALSGMGILSVAAVATLLLRKASASLRHLVWTAALAALVVIPVLEMSGLRLEVPVPAQLLKVVANLDVGDGFSTQPATEIQQLTSEAPVAGTVSGPSAAEPAVHHSSPTYATDGAAAGQVGRRMTGSASLAVNDAANVDWRSETTMQAANRHTRAVAWTAGGLLVGVWALGCLFFLGVTFFSHLAARSLTVRDVQRPSSTTQRRFAMLSDELGIRRPVQLLVSSKIRVPATWGLRRSTVMLPADYESWSRETLDRALLHELAHVRRRDCWSYLLAQFARAVHWPNPLVWVAVQNQRLESERACDDHVLDHGEPASAYAEDLVAMVRALRADAELPRAALAMAGQSGIGGRVRAVLDPNQARDRLGRLTMLIAGPFTIGLAAALAVVTPVAVAQEVPAQQPRTTVEPTEAVEPVDAPVAVPVVVPTSASVQFGRNEIQVVDFDFQVLRSDHFDWHFYPEGAAAVEDAVRMGERWYERLARSFQDEFEETKAVILHADHPDFQLDNRVILPLTGSYRDTDHALGHELVHAFQYNIAQSRRGGLQGVGGLPMWLIEGMAEYMSVGRDDPLTAMWVRDAIRRDDFPTIRQMTRESRFLPYPFGQALWAYVGGTYGDDAIVQIYRSALGIGFERAIQQVLGLDTETLSVRWRDKVAEEYLPFLAGRTAPEDQGDLLLAPSTGSGRVNISPSLSPDGRYVAFLSGNDLFSVDLYMADAVTGRIIRQLSSANSDRRTDALRSSDSSGTWSPDSRFFAYVVVAEGDSQIVVVNSDDGAVTQRISFDEWGIGAVANPSWSPDGRYIAFSGAAGGLSDLFLYDFQDEGVVRLTDDRYGDLQPSWSPNGRTLAFTSDRGPETHFENLTYSRLQISLIDIATREVEVHPIFGNVKHISPQYSADGGRIYFVSDQDGFSDIYEIDLNDRTVRRITKIATGISGPTYVAPALSVSASGVAAFTVFDQLEFHIYTLDLERPSETLSITGNAELQEGHRLPPVNPDRSSRVATYLADAQGGLLPSGALLASDAEGFHFQSRDR
jgi:Tol biopolymer transport system component/beta-lactamase regulating signal transducer with metallopeptidase domain